MAVRVGSAHSEADIEEKHSLTCPVRQITMRRLGNTNVSLSTSDAAQFSVHHELIARKQLQNANFTVASLIIFLKLGGTRCPICTENAIPCAYEQRNSDNHEQSGSAFAVAHHIWSILT